MTTLYLVRHGETVDNVNKIMQGQTHGELTENGRIQARKVRDDMADTNIDSFVSSDLKRSIETCEIIAEPHKRNVITTPLLRERDWGSFTGCYIPDLKDRKWTADIESAQALKDRGIKFLDFIRDNFPDQTVLAVGHGIINKAIQAVFYGKEMHEIPRMDNAEIRILHL